MTQLRWTPEQFWRTAVPEFWCAVDWLYEQNLDQEDEFEWARGQSQPDHQVSGIKNAQGVVVNPAMSIPTRPGWFAWRDQVRAARVSGRMKMRRLGEEPRKARKVG